MKTKDLMGSMPPPRATAGGPRWETCEIRCDFLSARGFRYTYAFRAEADGPKGRYMSGSSPPFKAWFNRDPHSSRAERRDLRTGAACDDLIAALGADGWASDPPAGRFWYSHRFRRPVT